LSYFAISLFPTLRFIIFCLPNYQTTVTLNTKQIGYKGPKTLKLMSQQSTVHCPQLPKKCLWQNSTPQQQRPEYN